MWRFGCAIALVISGCGRLAFEAANEPDAANTSWDPAWTRRTKLIFDNTNSAEDLIGFQTLVRLDPNRIDFGQTRPQGEDLRFVDADGVTVLSHEIEAWDALQDAVIWVRVPQIDARSTTDHIWLYYGNPAAADSQARELVWAEYHGVWHLGGVGTGFAGEFIDSSPRGKHATGGGGPATPVRTTGVIADGQQFDGIDDVITLTQAESSSFNFPTPQLTIEFWAMPDSARPGSSVPFSLSGWQNGYRLGFAPSGTVDFQITGQSYYCLSLAAAADGAWHYFVGTYDGTTMRIYLDGVKDFAEVPRAGALDPTTLPLLLGRADRGSAFDYPLLGPLDEPRVANVARSSSWVAAQYRSMTDTFITFNSE